MRFEETISEKNTIKCGSLAKAIYIRHKVLED